MVNISSIDEIIKNEIEDEFSGVILVSKNSTTLFEKAYGYANRNDMNLNKIFTRFGMASGCKIFTAVAICQLVQNGLLSFNTPLKDCLDISFPNFDPEITVHHLLTHSSGIPDYFDEEVMDDFSELWENRPMYNIRSPKDFLPMFKDREMEFKPGERFKYNNSGFIVLGLIVEQLSKISFTEYVEKNIFKPLGMTSSGYFRMDNLPKNTAYGYEKEESDNSWKTNIYSVPIIGGPDGGAFTTAKDMDIFWRALFNNKILDKEMTDKLLTMQIQDEDDFYYGYGVWIVKKDNEAYKYYVMGEDPGVSLISSVYPKENLQVTVIGNTEYGTWDVAREIQKMFF